MKQVLFFAGFTAMLAGAGAKENAVPHVWHVDSGAHDPTEWDNNLFLFSQHIFK